MENKMFACFPCSFSTDVAGDFVKHLSEKHKHQGSENISSAPDENTAILTDPIYKCPYCMFFHHQLAQVQNHITDRHEWSPGVSGSKTDDGRVNLIHVVDESTDQDQQLINHTVDKDQVEQDTSHPCETVGNKSLNLQEPSGSKAWASEIVKLEPENSYTLDEIEPVIQIRVENEDQKQACADIITAINTSQKHKENLERRVPAIKRVRRKPKRLADQSSDDEVDDDGYAGKEDAFDVSLNPKPKNRKRPADHSKMGRRRGGNGTHPCNHCFKVFKNKCDLERHVSNIHLKLKPYSCDRCSRSFGLRGNLKKHIDIVHFNKKRVNTKVTCPVCNNVYSSNHSLTLHVASVHSQEKRFQCEKCGMKFSWNGCYERHIRSVHLQEKNYKCDTCGTAFARKEHLRAHSKRHAPKDDSSTKNEDS